MGKRIIPNSNALKIRLSQESKPVTFVIGSAISRKHNDAGIPDVGEITLFISEHLKKQGLYDDYNEFIAEQNLKDDYKSGFEFISSVFGQDYINETIKRFVLSNVDPVTNLHKIPKAVSDFTTYIKDEKCKVANIVTTNFDTLIEESFEQTHCLKPQSYSLVSDSHIPCTQNDELKIVHIHGVWNKNDTMHTHSQLSVKRDKIEGSLHELFLDTLVVILAYGAWDDSFTRSLSNIVNLPNADYNIAWCFYSDKLDIIEEDFEEWFEKLAPAISRGRINFYKGVDCTTFFESETHHGFAKKKVTQSKDEISSQSFNFTYFDKRMDFVSVRLKEVNKAKLLLEQFKYIFIESGLGYGLSDFIYAVSLTMGGGESRLLKIDLSEVISKKQLETKIKVDAGADISQIIYFYTQNSHENVIFHFYNISSDIDLDALAYLRSIPSYLSVINPNAKFFFSSNSFIRSFRDIHVKLDVLSFHEVSLILKNRFEERNFTHEHLQSFHNLSEGIIRKLERIIYYLEDASAQDVIDKKDIFKGVSYFEVISSKTERQIENLKSSPDHEMTYLLIKILSVLKNGESFKNIRKTKIGSEIDLDDIKNIVDMGIAKTIVIDDDTSITKMNPIIKDYIISSMSQDEIDNISNDYLGITIIEMKDGLKINSTNRKVLEMGYSTEGDNGGYLLVNNIYECKRKIISAESKDQHDDELNKRRFTKLSQLSIGYIYALRNSSMYNEVISSAQFLLEAFGDTLPSQYYKYHLHIASSFRMLGKYADAQYHLEKCIALCPENDKSTIALCYVQQLYIYEMTEKEKAIELAKKRKKEFRKNSNAYIVSDQMISLQKERSERIVYLERLAKKARKLKFHTTANNILLDVNREKTGVKKMESLEEVLSHETSPYNQCRASINKYQIIVDNGQFEKIKEDDIRILKNVYNYLFNQRLDKLFKQCHEILWRVAEEKRIHEVIYLIYHKGQIIWILNDDSEFFNKYENLFDAFIIH